MPGTEHWLSAADFRETNGAALFISSNRKTSSGSLRNHTVSGSCNKKLNKFVQRAQNKWGPVERRGKEKKWKSSIKEKWKVKEVSRTVKDEEAKLS